ncbi:MULTISPECIES: 3D domain-containing protein [unclassified Romboutsia]|uniref:3D domain-containing protein n=1 Tax=unclassified Romboutsia TaxID=2626894 RepID=UPI000821189A|nr:MULTISPECIES: 3D domain-containing protein [unclassified Romboutsia]SCH66765.1 Cell wall-binding protein yocH precursor [uncultured Clostridium sp.]
MKRMLLMTAAAMTLLLTPCGLSKSYAAENSSINIENTIIGHINAYTVNFRDGASLDANIYYTLDKNEELQIISSEGNWTKVIHNNQTGYIYSKYVTKDTKDIEVSDIENYSSITVKATAYAGDTITSTGTTPKWGTIAVDPNVIPYGTKVYIPEFDMIFIAEDTGSAIKGNRIDIFMYTEDNCNQWGVRNIEIYIIS